MIDFCTYCDHRYLPRALVLAESLDRHCGPFTLWLLALSDRCRRLLEIIAHPRIRCFPLEGLEASDAALAASKAGRSLIEYFFTLSPCWPLHLMRSQPAMKALTYLDSDLCFFASPNPIFDELGASSVGIVPHRFPSALADEKRRYGTYNVGWITWRRDETGLACLEDWRARCLEWCHDRCEDGKFADQGYLDEWPGRFPGVHVIRHPGANVAPWNAAGHIIRKHGGRLLSDGRLLIFYHFHGLSRLDPRYLRTHLDEYVPSWARRRDLVRLLYRPYLSGLARWQAVVDKAAVALGPDTDLTAKRSHGRVPDEQGSRSLTKKLRFAWNVYSGKFVYHPAA